MADKKISALTAATTPLAGTEVLPIVQSGATVKVSVANLTAGRAVGMAGGSFTDNLTQGTAAKGINFTANTPAAGMTSQLLNWYEEGTWTPSYQTTGGSFTYDIRTGSYTRIGNVVYCNFRLSTSAVTPGTGQVLLAGLPFAQKNDANARGSFGIGDARSFGGDFPSGLVTEQIGTTTVSITYRTAANGGVTNLDASDLSTSGSFQNIIAGSFFYIV